MTTSTPDIQPAVQHTAQVAIVGAGPVGLMMANYLGQMGISVLVAAYHAVARHAFSHPKRPLLCRYPADDR